MEKTKKERVTEIKAKMQAKRERRKGPLFPPRPTPPKEPPFTPENAALVAHFEENFSKYEYVGPVRKTPIFKTARDIENVLFVEGDLSGNNLSDYVGFVRSKHHDEIILVVAFFQHQKDQFESIRLPLFPSLDANYLEPCTVGNLRHRYKRIYKNEQHPTLFMPEIPDDTFAVNVGHIAGSHHGLFLSPKGPCVVKIGC